MAKVVPSSLEEWLAYQTRVHPIAIDLGLERLAEVLRRLQWRRPAVPVISVAGTNGKGSVVATAAAILAAAGLRAGVFTSPHLRDYRERIRLAGHCVGEQPLLRAFERIERARGEISLTFFEYNTLAALLIFEAQELDAWILEVGMGGRLDAVNVVDPDVAVVVSIGFDHQQFLGSTLESIAREKAGIFRAGRAAVLGSRSPPPALADAARAIGAKLKRLGVEFDYRRDGERWAYRSARWDLADLPPSALHGDAQYDNAATAIAALEELAPRLPIRPLAVAAGLRSVRLAARFQLIDASRTVRAGDANGPAWILDVAHNQDAARVLARNLRALPVSGRTVGICGILADKDASAIVAELAGAIDEWWFVSTEGERGRSGAALSEGVAADVQAPAHAADAIADACDAALAACRRGDRVVIFGSFHTVGPAIDWLEARDVLPKDDACEYTAAPRGIC